MSIEVNCKCGKKFKVKDSLLGKTIRCKKCGAETVVSDLSVAIGEAVDVVVDVAGKVIRGVADEVGKIFKK
jgi:transcription elongation factor Elf1